MQAVKQNGPPRSLHLPGRPKSHTRSDSHAICTDNTSTISTPAIPAVKSRKRSHLARRVGIASSLRAQLARIQAQVGTAEESLKERLQGGARIQPGDHFAELKEHSRRNVAWKAVVVRLALRLKLDGEAYCERVLAATKPSKSYSLEVQ